MKRITCLIFLTGIMITVIANGIAASTPSITAFGTLQFGDTKTVIYQKAEEDTRIRVISPGYGAGTILLFEHQGYDFEIIPRFCENTLCEMQWAGRTYKPAEYSDELRSSIQVLVKLMESKFGPPSKTQKPSDDHNDSGFPRWTYEWNVRENSHRRVIRIGVQRTDKGRYAMARMKLIPAGQSKNDRT